MKVTNGRVFYNTSIFPKGIPIKIYIGIIYTILWSLFYKFKGKKFDPIESMGWLIHLLLFINNEKMRTKSFINCELTIAITFMWTWNMLKISRKNCQKLKEINKNHPLFS